MTVNKAMMFAATLTIVVSVAGLAVETAWVIKGANLMIVIQWSLILFTEVLKYQHKERETIEAQYLDILSDETPRERDSIPEALRRFVIERDAFTCTYCDEEGEPNFDPDGRSWEIDHVVPITKGGKTIPANLTLSCFACNRAKGNKTPFQFLRYRRERQYIRRRFRPDV